MEGVVVLGATGSIGRTTLSVLRRHPDRFRVLALTASHDLEGLDALAREFDPEFVAAVRESDREFTPSWKGEWRYGEDCVADAAGADGASVVVNGLVGVTGLEPSIRALRGGRRLALANRESLVAGGELVLEALEVGGGELLPVESGLSGIHQCIGSRSAREVSRVVLMASGGPFRETSPSGCERIEPEDGGERPTRELGRKVAVDSATLADKALEVIEAHRLFGIPYDRIEVVVHPESVVHCMVEFQEGTTLAGLGVPDMEVPILRALTHPDHPGDDFRPFDPVGSSPLTFERPRREDFPMLELGIGAGRRGALAAAAFIAANEVAVRAFLERRIGVDEVPEIVETSVAGAQSGEPERLADVWRADRRSRERAAEAVERSAGVGERREG